MRDRTYTFTFKDDDFHAESSDEYLDEDQIGNIIVWACENIYPEHPLNALDMLYFMVRAHFNRRSIPND